MLVDNVTLIIKAGDGGNGAATFFRNARTAKGGPDGGNGGNGGNIYIQGSHNITDLREFRFKKKITALDGTPGKKWNLYGKNAPHIIFYAPLGTQIIDKETNTTLEITDVTTPILLALGGKGGRGNTMFKSATNQTPLFAEKGTLGEKKTLLLELKLIADIGLIGLPNAGKSSLLSVLTNATPKIGNYPFTTLEPTIGMFEKHAIADIPGLIEGAANGKGLGTTFLRHIEKTKILVHCIEVMNPHIFADYETVRKELEKHNPQLIKKPEIILLTKIDLTDAETVKKHVLFFRKKRKKVLVYSVYDPQSINTLKREIKTLLT